MLSLVVESLEDTMLWVETVESTGDFRKGLLKLTIIFTRVPSLMRTSISRKFAVNFHSPQYMNRGSGLGPHGRQGGKPLGKP